MSPFIYLYDVNTLRIFECASTALFMVNTKSNDYEKSYFIINNRKPCEYDVEYMKLLYNNINNINFDSILISYVVQAIIENHGDIAVSSKVISEYYKYIFKCDISDEYLFEINRYIRNGYSRLFCKDLYNNNNVLQLMHVAAVFDSNNISKSDNSIKFLFNKIYKRSPLSQEINIIKSLDLDSGIKGIRNEVIKYLKVREINFRRRYFGKVR